MFKITLQKEHANTQPAIPMCYEHVDGASVDTLTSTPNTEKLKFYETYAMGNYANISLY